MKSAVENDRTFSLYQRLNVMRIPRIYHPESLKNQSTCQLSEDAANHVRVKFIDSLRAGDFPW